MTHHFYKECLLGPWHTSSRHQKFCSAATATWGQARGGRQAFQLSPIYTRPRREHALTRSLTDLLMRCRPLHTLHLPGELEQETDLEFGNIFTNSEIPGHLGSMILANRFRSQVSVRIDSPLLSERCRPPSLAGRVGCERGKMEVRGHWVVLIRA